MSDTSDEPLRWLDDPGTSAQLREELEKERSAPWAYDSAAGLAALQAAIQASGPLPSGDGPGDAPHPPDAGPPQAPAPAPAPAAASGSAAGTAAAVAKGGVAGKGLLFGLAALGVVASIGVGLQIADRSPATPAIPAPVVPTAAIVEAPPTPAPSASEAPAAAAATAATAATPERPRPPGVATIGSVGGGAPLPAPRPAGNAEEIAHMIALREKAADDPAGALRLADEGQQRFSGGLFSTEREFLAISSLARLGRTAEARSRGARLIAAHPSSPYVDRVRAVIGAP